MAREGLRHELTGAFQKALRKKGPATLHGLKVKSNGHEQTVDVTVETIEEPEALRGMVLLVFTDVATPEAHENEALADGKRFGRRGHATKHEQELLHQDLHHLREELHMTREEMQTSQEEYRSANEELQSANEELQSTNEELTTSREEMQSLNEELQSVNAELQSKVDELTSANSDMKNLLNSTEIATLFLDSAFNVRRFTTQATRIIRLAPGDAGRPITDIASDLLYPELLDDAREVLRTLHSVEKQITTQDGRWFATRIMPYRTLDNVIDGVVITFSDITAVKKLEAELRELRD